MPRTKTTAMPTAGRRFRLVFVLVAGLAVLLDSFSIGRNTALVSKTELSAAAGRQGKSGAGLDRNGEEEGEPSSSPAAKPPVPQTNKDDANDRFSVFASEQTPLLAELLATQTNNGESDDKNERSGGDNSSLPSAPPRAGSAATTADNPGTEAPAFVYSSLRQRSPEIAIVGLATVAVSGILGDLLSEYEWVQALRYFWPLSIGVYYGTLLNQAADGNSGGNGRLARMRQEFGPDVAVNPDASADDDCDGEPSSSSSSSSSSNPVLQLGYILGGAGLFLGGLADAVLPVWMTGPNFLTHAGLAPDCAVLLLVLAVGEEYLVRGPRTNDNDNTITMTAPALMKIVLWAELFKLGEGSLEEVFGIFQTAISSSG